MQIGCNLEILEKKSFFDFDLTFDFLSFFAIFFSRYFGSKKGLYQPKG
jgi:hypothetical protein